MDNILYFDCLAGISGDMTVGALLDLGVDVKDFKKQLSKLVINEYDISIEKNQKNGITGTDFKVKIHHHHEHDNNHSHNHSHGHHEHRNLNDINKIINKSDLSKNVKKMSKKMFKYVAEAEAKVHDKPIDEIHFHEVGAVDSIVDIVGTAICVDLLDIDKICFSSLHIGTGFVKCAHGNIPVPVPATLEILKGIPVYSTGIKSELVTPTGAAIAKTLVDDFINIPKIEIENIGYGLADKDLEITNLLRVFTAKKKSMN